MTVETTSSKQTAQQMGVSFDYDFTLDVLLKDPTEEEALKSIKAKVKLADPEEPELTLVYGTDYTVTLNKDRSGGTLTVVDKRTTDDYITIYREYDLTQEADYQDFNALPAETLEQCFDKLTMLEQQQQEVLDRCVKVDMTSDVEPSDFAFEVNRVYESIDNIDTVADIKEDVQTVADVSEDVTTCAENIEDIKTAKTSAENAAASAISAEASKNKAQEWAIKMDGPVDDNEYSAKYWAAQAAGGQVQADMAEEDTTQKSYVLNKQLYVKASDNSIANLTDVELTNIQNKQILGYNTTTEKFENIDLPNPLTKFSINDGKITNGVEDVLNAPIGIVDVPFIQPTMTENGTIGGDNFAVSASSTRGDSYAYKAINGGSFSSNLTSSNITVTYTFYNPQPLKISNIAYSNNDASVYNSRIGYIQASNDGQSWTQVASLDGITTSRYRHSYNITDNNYYKYWQIVSTSNTSSSGGYYGFYINNLVITATYQETQIVSDTLYFNVDNNNPITYTNGNGETYTKTGLNPIDVSDKADGIYNVMLNSSNQPYLHSGNIYYQKGEPTNTTIVGSPTIIDGVASGFSASNYLKYPNNFRPSSNSWEMKFKIRTGNNVTTTQFITSMQKGSTNETRYATRLFIDDSHFKFSVTYNGTSFDIAGNTIGSIGTYTVLPNTTYYLKFEYTGSAYKVSYSLDDINYTQDCYVASTTPMYNECTYCVIGLWNDGANVYAFLGSIDIKESYIKIDGQIWWRYGIYGNDVWLNKVTQKAYKYTDNELVEIADVPCGKVTVASGIITQVLQPIYNVDFQKTYIIKSYVNGTSGYNIYSPNDNGNMKCEQWGYFSPATSSITFVKNFKDTNFIVITQPTAKTLTSGVVATHQSNFNYRVDGFSTVANTLIDGYVWIAKGYLADNQIGV